MTIADAFNAEAEKLMAANGFYIPPYRLAALMKAAQKVADYITTGNLCVSYGEMKLVLKIVDNAIDSVAGGAL